jgi:hypothetical protein
VTRTEQVLYIGRDEETSQSQKQADESREVNYFCNPNSFFFSTGLKWGVERRDAVGSVEFISEGMHTMNRDFKRLILTQ